MGSPTKPFFYTFTHTSACRLQAQDISYQWTNGYAKPSKESTSLASLYSCIACPTLAVPITLQSGSWKSKCKVDGLHSHARKWGYPLSPHKLHLKTAFPCQAEGGNVRHGRALSGAWDGLRGQEFMAQGAVGSLPSCKVWHGASPQWT